MSPVDARFMERALFLAERGRGRTTPNPVVGAVVVSPGGVVVGHGAHLEAGGPHAEVHAIEMAGARAVGATMYVTLEPCCHTGRTGPCVERIVTAGIGRVVAAVRDPNPRVAGGGFAYLRTHGIEVVEHVCAEAAERQNAAFFTWVTAHRPFVIVKMAVSSDGFVARTSRVRLSGAVADRWMHRQRAAVDAIAVGAGTVIADDPRLTARGAYRYRPLTRVIVDWRARTSPTAAVYSTVAAGPVIMVVSADAAGTAQARLEAIRAQGVDVEINDGRDLASVMRQLAARDIVTLLVEGGPALVAACAGGQLIDRLQWIVTPAHLGDGVAAIQDATGDLIVRRPPRVTRLGMDVLLEFDVHRTH